MVTNMKMMFFFKVTNVVVSFGAHEHYKQVYTNYKKKYFFLLFESDSPNKLFRNTYDPVHKQVVLLINFAIFQHVFLSIRLPVVLIMGIARLVEHLQQMKERF